jgi:HlyD family secretion protein
MAAKAKKIGRAIAAIAIAVFLIWGLTKSFGPRTIPLQAQMDAQEINVSSKVPGRVGKLNVRLGDNVEVGDILFELDSPEVRAKVAQARAAHEAAEASAEKADAGSRTEEVAAARYNWERAETAARIARVTYQRLHSMFSEGVIALQKRDEAEAQWRGADRQALAARAQYEMARRGARKEDKSAAEAQARQVAGVVSEAEAGLAETQIKAPARGEVSKVQIQPGELAPQGFPVVTLVDLDDNWAVLQIREDEMAPFGMGTTHIGHIQALKQDARFAVSFIGPLPDFATWRAARPGGIDLRTFEVRLRPTTSIAGLRPGMTVVFSPH